ncbi:hypothetical protein PRIPAC_91222 [Pristionchus pacificus]|uniref:Uncharacterized protein n=1 Tax=Pristionchus pacificus TaxID=54126 RepID=A0A454XIU3_PRIPA|nr:hypothetical protein PRIPAC_91222 [Pristionchus pacificus]|eukprot:PDM82811.1 hypothetical protein PRIPAC_37204 [Pristionchus pacificus]
MSAKFIIILLLIAIVAVQIECIRVQQCDEVCPRIPRERDECCKANGHAGGMDGGLCFFGLAFCKD